MIWYSRFKDADREIVHPKVVAAKDRGPISNANLRVIVNLIGRRSRAVVVIWTNQILSWPLRAFLWPGVRIIPWLTRRPILNALKLELRPSSK